MHSNTVWCIHSLMHSNTVWCTVIQSDVFPSLMYFPVWCISQSDETVFPPGLVAAGYAAGDVEPSVCYLVAQPDRRVVHTLPYRRRQYLVQVLAYIWLQHETWALAYIPSSQSWFKNPYREISQITERFPQITERFPKLQRDFPNYREISQITERFTKLQRAFFPKLSKLYFPVWSNCISSEVRVDIHQWVCSIKRLGWWLQSGPPSSCQCRGCQGPGLLGGRTPVSPVESLPHPEHNQPTGGSGKSTWNKWKGPQIPLRANTT